MVRTYQKRTGRESNEEGAKAAVEDVLQRGASLRVAAAQHGVKKSRLGYLVKKAKECGLDNMVYSTNFKNRQVIPDMMEKLLSEYLLKCSSMFYGLTPKMARKLAYQYAKRNGLKVPPTWDERGEAGEDWFSAFMKRQPNLSLRTPEATSLARMTAFNRHTVGTFFDKLECVLKRHSFRPNQIFNLDETGVTTVPRTEKIIGEKGRKQVGQVTSRERGELVTQVGIICANGNALPPVWIFPRVRFDENRMMSGATVGALGLVHKSGWMTTENFIKVLEFFKHNVRCTKESPVLLIMDNHESHLSLQGLDFCNENGIIVLTLPPHTSNRLQPLDRSVFGPFKKFFSSNVNSWMNSNPNVTLNIYALPKLCSSAWDRGATPENIKSGFRATGIVPFDRDVFSDQDFLSSAVSDRRLPTGANAPVAEKNPSVAETTSTVAISGTSSPAIDAVSPECVRPLPKGTHRQQSNRGRKRGRCMIATDTPERMELEKKKASPIIKRKVLASSSSSSEDDIEDLCEESGESAFSSSQSSEESDSDDEADGNGEDVKEADYVVVKFPQKKTIVHYIGSIVKVIQPKYEYEIRFLRRKGMAFIYPTVEDKAVVVFEDICKKISLSSVRRGKHYFADKTLRKFPNVR